MERLQGREALLFPCSKTERYASGAEGAGDPNEEESGFFSSGKPKREGRAGKERRRTCAKMRRHF